MAHARLKTRSRTPFISDLMQWVPREMVPVAHEGFWAHSSTDCVVSKMASPASVSFVQEAPANSDTSVCKNPLFFLSTHPEASERCELPSDEEFWSECMQFEEGARSADELYASPLSTDPMDCDWG